MRVCTLANRHVIDDLRVFFSTLRMWNSPAPHVHVATDTETAPMIAGMYPSELLTVHVWLDRYKGLNRREMEARPGERHPTLFGDFTAEKCGLVEAAGAAGEPVLFADADICFLGALPTPPAGTKLALSRHMIRAADEARFGTYNAGYIWTSEPVRMAELWRTACRSSRFFEQAALEDVRAAYADDEVYEFPIQVNYGWWRMWQSDVAPAERQREWGIHRAKGCGVLVRGEPLLSIHTHWFEKRDRATVEFNRWVAAWFEKVRARDLLKIISGDFQSPQPPRS